MRHSFGPVHGELTTLPGCSQIVVSHNVYSTERGHAVAANEERQAFCLSEGYDFMICTVDISNVAQRNVLDRTGWRKIDEFRSRKTGHTIGVFSKCLTVEVK